MIVTPPKAKAGVGESDKRTDSGSQGTQNPGRNDPLSHGLRAIL
jgi:hypothetical protein